VAQRLKVELPQRVVPRLKVELPRRVVPHLKAERPRRVAQWERAHLQLVAQWEQAHLQLVVRAWRARQMVARWLRVPAVLPLVAHTRPAPVA